MQSTVRACLEAPTVYTAYRPPCNAVAHLYFPLLVVVSLLRVIQLHGSYIVLSSFSQFMMQTLSFLLKLMETYIRYVYF